MKAIEFPTVLTKNHYTNFQNKHICFLLKFKFKADNKDDLAVGTAPVNNFLLIG